MPYGLRKKGKHYQVYNKDSGHVYSNTTQAKAKRQLKLLEGIEHDPNFKAKARSKSKRKRS